MTAGEACATAFIRLWNWLVRSEQQSYPGDLVLGARLSPDLRRRGAMVLRRTARPEHVAVLGKTGTGKTTLLRTMCEQDIRTDFGFVFFDLHGQVTESLIARAAENGRKKGVPIEDRVILVDPSNRDWSIGINFLESFDEQGSYVKAAELVEVLKARWKLDTFGARTEELLRNTLLLLMNCCMTLVEIEPLLTDSVFRAHCLTRARDGPTKTYFELRFAALSPAMRAVVVEPILNKISAFTADPHIRHIVGQAYSTLNFSEALKHHKQIIVNLDKGRLGPQAYALGSLILAQIKSALFARKSAKVFTLYCDEIQNLVAHNEGLDSLLAEARKFGVSVVSANQYLDQLDPAMRAAILSCGSHIFFRLSGADAGRVTHGIGESNAKAKEIINLPARHFISHIQSQQSERAETIEATRSRASTNGLRNKIAKRWGTPRAEVEAEISARVQVSRKELDDWE